VAHICEFFPCHEWKDGMTCEYCYCPIYEKECKAFGGNPKFIDDGSKLVKDCSDCTLPHEPNFENLLTKIKKDVIIKE